LFEFKCPGDAIAPYELEFRRDDSIMRYLTVKLDKHAAAWAEKRKERVKSSNPKK
jgi:small subunit ribosomal protein S6